MGLNIFPVQKDNLLSQFDYDLFVIGAGSGGVRAARMAADKGPVSYTHLTLPTIMPV